MFPAVESRVREEVGRLRGRTQRWVVVEAALLLEAEWDAWVGRCPACAHLWLTCDYDGAQLTCVTLIFLLPGWD